jgi:hypothetical protein
LNGASNDGVVDRSQTITIHTTGGTLSEIGESFNEVSTGRNGFTKLQQAVNVGELDVSFFDGIANISASSKFQAQLNQSSCRFNTINSASGDNTLREIAIIDGAMVDSTTGNNPTNTSVISRNYFTGGASVSDLATYNLTGGSASNAYQQTLNSANSTLILTTTDAVSPYTTSAALTSIKNGEVSCQLSTTDTANNKTAFNNARAQAGTMSARTEIKVVETGATPLTSDLDLISDATSCRIQQTYIAGAANNFSTITTNSTGLNITSTNSALTLTAATTATLQSGSSSVNASSTAVSNSAAQILMNSTTAGAIANPSFIFRESNATAAAFPTIKTEKLLVVPTVGNTISAITNWAADATGTQREWSRIQTKVENITAGNQDSTLSIFNSVNGSILETFNFNGAQNENNSFRPLDMNGNPIRTTSGDMTISATASSGTGNIIISPKVNTGVSTLKMTGSVVGDEMVVEKNTNFADFFQTGGSLNTNAQMRLGNGGLRMITNSAVPPTFGLDNASFATATHQFTGSNYDITLPSTGTFSYTNASTINVKGASVSTSTGNLTLSATTSSTAGATLTLATKDNVAGSGAGLVLTGNTLTSASAGVSSGQYLCLTIGSVVYKIALLNAV